MNINIGLTIEDLQQHRPPRLEPNVEEAVQPQGPSIVERQNITIHEGQRTPRIKQQEPLHIKIEPGKCSQNDEGQIVHSNWSQPVSPGGRSQIEIEMYNAPKMPKSNVKQLQEYFNPGASHTKASTKDPIEPPFRIAPLNMNLMAKKFQKPRKPFQMGPNMRQLMRRNKAAKRLQWKSIVRQKVRAKIHRLHNEFKLADLQKRRDHPVGDWLNAFSLIEQDLLRLQRENSHLILAKFNNGQNITDEAQNIQGLEDDYSVKVPDYKTDPLAHMKYIKDLFKIRSQFKTQRLTTVPYLLKIYRKVRQMKPSKKWEQPEFMKVFKYIYFNKPIQCKLGRTTFHEPKYFLPFGWLPRLGVYDGRNPLHLYPFSERVHFQMPVSGPKIRNSILKQIDQISEDQMEVTPSDWAQQLAEKIEAIQDHTSLHVVNKSEEQILIQIQNSSEKSSITKYLPGCKCWNCRSSCKCGKCQLIYTPHCNTTNPHWWSDTMGCQYTGFLGYYFLIEQGPFFTDVGIQSKPLQFRVRKGQQFWQDFRGVNRGLLEQESSDGEELPWQIYAHQFKQLQILDPILEEKADPILNEMDQILKKPDFHYNEQFTPLPQQYWNQIENLILKIQQINKDLSVNHYGAKVKELKDQRQRLYRRKHTLKQNFLSTIFAKMPPQNQTQYLALKGLQIQVFDEVVRYQPKQPFVTKINAKSCKLNNLKLRTTEFTGQEEYVRAEGRSQHDCQSDTFLQVIGQQ